MHPLAQILRPYVGTNDLYSARELAVLAYLSTATPGASSVRHIAAALGIEKPTITQVCDKLFRSDLIDREANERDRRSLLMRPTLGGFELLARSADALAGVGGSVQLAAE